MKFFLSCEHGGCHIPEKYALLFKDAEHVLSSHRGWDPGALKLFRMMDSAYTHHSAYNEVSRLLIELNRSLHHRQLFSTYTASISDSLKDEIVRQYYLPYRNAFSDAVGSVVQNNEMVFHVSVHSFTPVLNDVTRNADIGLLYDPRHGMEKEIAKQWKQILVSTIPGIRVRFNYPYSGKADGHVVALRKTFGNLYSGIELEMNNAFSENVEVMRLISHSYSVLCEDVKSLQPV
ncbi:N-formylglutamate amidohydrolase [Alkaliflexus imshenetskii]|uniref:N-formylglutamate amidohydrolase n=1 Tax=Alkaliflexus imshenetskii TaxID=286730 RepID=UPI00047D9457|nr:N-formylglutamate amidohydrolase [Alkaliflexus imshenetskii]